MATADTAGTGRTTAGTKTNLQKAAMVIGVIFLLVGILGFVPGITTNYDQLGFAGHESEAYLLGVFQVSALHNIVHLLFGIAGIAMARTHSGAFNYLLWGGIIYLVLFIYGLIVSPDSAANFVPLNSADNWLHIGLTIIMVGLALALKGSTHNDAAARPARRA